MVVGYTVGTATKGAAMQEQAVGDLLGCTNDIEVSPWTSSSWSYPIGRMAPRRGANGWRGGQMHGRPSCRLVLHHREGP